MQVARSSNLAATPEAAPFFETSGQGEGMVARVRAGQLTDPDGRQILDLTKHESRLVLVIEVREAST